MKILRLTGAALAAAAAIGISGAAIAAPASNLSEGQQATQRDDKNVTQVQYYYRHGYYYNPYYYPRYYYSPYYGYPYGYGYYGSPGFNFGIHIR